MFSCRGGLGGVEIIWDCTFSILTAGSLLTEWISFSEWTVAQVYSS